MKRYRSPEGEIFEIKEGQQEAARRVGLIPEQESAETESLRRAAQSWGTGFGEEALFNLDDEIAGGLRAGYKTLAGQKGGDQSFSDLYNKEKQSYNDFKKGLSDDANSDKWRRMGGNVASLTVGLAPMKLGLKGAAKAVKAAKAAEELEGMKNAAMKASEGNIFDDIGSGIKKTSSSLKDKLSSEAGRWKAGLNRNIEGIKNIKSGISDLPISKGAKKLHEWGGSDSAKSGANVFGEYMGMNLARNKVKPEDIMQSHKKMQKGAADFEQAMKFNKANKQREMMDNIKNMDANPPKPKEKFGDIFKNFSDIDFTGPATNKHILQAEALKAKDKAQALKSGLQSTGKKVKEDVLEDAQYVMDRFKNDKAFQAQVATMAAASGINPAVLVPAIAKGVARGYLSKKVLNQLEAGTLKVGDLVEKFGERSLKNAEFERFKNYRKDLVDAGIARPLPKPRVGKQVVYPQQKFGGDLTRAEKARDFLRYRKMQDDLRSRPGSNKLTPSTPKNIKAMKPLIDDYKKWEIDNWSNIMEGIIKGKKN